MVRLADLFEGRRQLLLYHFWFPPDGEPCGGCSMFTDQVSPLAHLQRARHLVRARLDRARRPRSQRFKRRMGWELPWYTVVGDGVPAGARDHRVLLARRLPARRRPRLPHLRDHRPRRRGARQRLDLPRPDAARPPGGVGGHAARPPADAAVRVVAAARRVRVEHLRDEPMIVGHLAGFPLEELLSLAPAAGAAWLGWRCRPPDRDAAGMRRLDRVRLSLRQRFPSPPSSAGNRAS